MTPGAPVVYFIDDSATMREVIKIAFRREHINVLACHDGATALAQMEQTRPDVVISDVIMPDKDGYEVCEHIKHNPKLARTPVILMSGVVNRSVAERAFAVKADELIRKPFQPQDLIARVKHLLNPRAASAAPPTAAISANAALSSIFSSPAGTMSMPPRGVAAAAPRMASAPAAAMMPPLATTPSPAARTMPPAPAVAPPRINVAVPPPVASAVTPPPAVAPVLPKAAATPASAAPERTTPANGNGDATRTKVEVLRLQGLVRKLQAELEAEREYSRALEAHVKTLQESE